MTSKPHFTTRRSFVAAAGFGGVSLYGLWAAYGAAPSPMALLAFGKTAGAPHGADHGQVAAAPPPQSAEGGAHSGHGGAASGGPNSEEFSQMAAEFSERYRLTDGRVHPRRLPAAPTPAHDPHAGHNMDAMAVAAPISGPHEAIDVLMTAGKWYYLPHALRLDAGQAYRFRMMALDVTHGASIQFGRGGRMMRLQPGRITETELTFEKPGRYLMHCTVYCGEAHDLMQATIEVV